jgi:general secretion pathway protein G
MKRTRIIAGIIILVLVCAWAITANFGGSGNARIPATRASIQSLCKMAEQFKAEMGRYPNDAHGIDELVRWLNEKHTGPRTGSQIPMDAWGSKFIYRLTEDGPIITSLGPDLTLSTPDDIIGKKN